VGSLSLIVVLLHNIRITAVKRKKKTPPLTLKQAFASTEKITQLNFINYPKNGIVHFIRRSIPFSPGNLVPANRVENSFINGDKRLYPPP